MLDIGELVAIVKLAAGAERVLVKVPAIVTKVYENVHGQVVADLHELESTIHGIVVKESNPPETIAVDGPVVTTDISAKPEDAIPAEAGAATVNTDAKGNQTGTTNPAPTPTPPAATAPSAQLTEEESAYANLSPEDQAAFEEFLASRGSTQGQSTGGDVPPAATTGEGAPS